MNINDVYTMEYWSAKGIRREVIITCICGDLIQIYCKAQASSMWHRRSEFNTLNATHVGVGFRIFGFWIWTRYSK